MRRLARQQSPGRLFSKISDDYFSDCESVKHRTILNKYCGRNFIQIESEIILESIFSNVLHSTKKPASYTEKNFKITSKLFLPAWSAFDVRFSMPVVIKFFKITILMTYSGRPNPCNHHVWWLADCGWHIGPARPFPYP